MNLLQILDEVMLLSGLGTETAYAASSDDEVKRAVSIANQAAVSIVQYPWQALRGRYEIGLTTDTEYPLPDDFRAFIPNTLFVNGQIWPADFPADTAEWSYLKSGSIGSTALTTVRLLGDELHIHSPTSGDAISFEYLSKYPVLAGVTPQQRFTADTDTWRLDDDLILRDILWRHKKMLGMQDWQIDMADAKGYENQLRGTDKSAQTLMPGHPTTPESPYYPLWQNA